MIIIRFAAIVVISHIAGLGVAGRFLDLQLMYPNDKLQVRTTKKIDYDDVFYQPPTGFESSKPGTILRCRTTPNNLALFYGNFSIDMSWQLLVRLNDARGRPIAIVTTIARPQHANTLQVVSYQIAQDSANSRCAPSFMLQEGAGIGDTVTMQPEFVFVQRMLKSGYYVVIPDHQGPSSGFTVGRLQGKTTLDSLRAAYQSGETTGILPNALLVLWGYSGGSVALAWASILQTTYAPELSGRILGVALGGLVPNITATAAAVDGLYLSGLITNAVRGLIQEYPQEISQIIYLSMGPGWPRYLSALSNLCLMTTIQRFAWFNFFDGPNKVFKQGWNLVRDPRVAKILFENTLAVDEETLRAPPVPVFLYHGKHDRVAPINEVYRIFDAWCGSNLLYISIEFTENCRSGHLSEFAEGLLYAMAWIDDRFEGKSVQQGCHKETRYGANMFDF